MLEVFKILNGFDNNDREHFLVYSRSTLKGHNMKFFKPRCRLATRKFTFSNRVTDAWKILPQDFKDSYNVKIA